MYIVVFVNENKNGFNGLRTWQGFANQVEFKRFAIPEGLSVLAESIDEEEALRLTCLTPETSRVKASIEEAFTGDHFNFDYFWTYLYNRATFTIEFDREHLYKSQFHLNRAVPNITPLDTLKDTLFATVDACSAGDRVDLRQLKVALLQATVYFLLQPPGGPDDGDMLG